MRSGDIKEANVGHTTVGLLLILVFGLLSTPLAAEAQQMEKVPRIGFLAAGRGVTYLREAFRQGLRELGYIEGENLLLEWRFAEGRAERIPEFVAELVRLNVDVIVSGGGEEAILAVK